MLKEQYEGVFSPPRRDTIITDPDTFFNAHPESPHQLTNIQVTEQDIISAINKITPNAAAGPDGFHAQLLKNCREQLALPLRLLWSKSLECGHVPQTLKYGTITPIHKGGSKGIAKNYRPVVLTSHLIKIIERVIRAKLVTFLEDTNALNDGQHGFRRGRSCLSQLLSHFDNILQDIQEGDNVDVIYLDFAKAFDKVDHGILLHKLQKLGVHGELGKWLHSFLSNRKQRVTVRGTLSEASDVVSGVPQGSVLGPLLFLIMVGDIDRDLEHSRATSFADDTRIVKKITSHQDASLLQEDLEKILKWAEDNNMVLNGDKFELLRYGQQEDLKNSTQYRCGQEEITAKTSVKDLGVKMSNDATFSQHMFHVTAVAKQLAGWVLRTFQTRNAKCMLTLWKSLILPRTEYCCQLWSPHKVTDIAQIEAPQRTFTSKINGVQHLNYWERLKELNLYSLQRRRERYTIIYVWKILEQRVPNVSIQETNHPRRGRLCYVRTTPGATHRIKTLVHHSFTYNGTRLFNCIPASLRNMTGLAPDTFKTHLDKWLADIPDQPPTPGYTTTNSNSLNDWIAEGMELPGYSGAPAQLRR